MAAFASSLPMALAMAGVATFFVGTSYFVGATTLGQLTPVRLIGRVTAIYFLFQSLLGQTLGPFLVAYGSQRVFTGPTALAQSMVANCIAYGVAAIASAIALRAVMRHRERTAVPAVRDGEAV